MTKYNAIRCELDGHKFDSKAEMKRYADLKLRERVGEISHLELQPVYQVNVNGVPICKYKADFRYFEKNAQKQIVEDVKGVITPVYRLKKKLVEAIYHVKIIEVKAK